MIMGETADPVTFQWAGPDGSTPNSGIDISSSGNTSELRFVPAQESQDAGRYTCQGTLSGNTASNFADVEQVTSM